MRFRKIFQLVQPYLAVVAVFAIASLLVFAIYFTDLNMQWATFLTGILIASIVGMTSRASRAEWISTRRAAQLTLLKDKLEQETLLRKKAIEEKQQALSLLQQTERAFGRLIPHQLLALMGRNNILDVQLGDQFERKLTVMSTDIRNFTSLSENMSPQENFNFLNSYLAQMTPVINTHRGIIDKYIGDSIMALFTQSADDAVSGAVHMLENLEKYNSGRARAGYGPMQIGIGLNTGLAMIGTVGGTSRMDSTVIGDVVNLASRIESATKTYFTPLLISQNTLYNLTVPGKYDIRFLDRIRVKGKTQPLSIFEVFDNDSIKVRDSKRIDKAKFESAIAYYHLKEIPRAMELLNQCLEATPKDIPARIYLSRCEQYLSTGQHYSTGELNNQLQWKKEFQTTIDVVDQSHRQLFNKVNEFISASLAKDTKAIRIIFAYLASHFTESKGEEEEIMDQHNYPFTKDHVREHKRLIEDFMALKEEVDAEDYDMSSLSFRVQLLLFDWFSGHISNSDRHVARHIINANPPSTVDIGASTMQLRGFFNSTPQMFPQMELPIAELPVEELPPDQ
jgi:adenylate cyclase